MAISDELISKLVKVTNDRGRDNQNYTVYGTVTTDGNRNYVKLDGSDISTPVETTVEISPDDRVIVEVKNHTATVTGNTSDISIGTKTANGIKSSITQTAEQIRLEVSDEVNKLNSSITQTAGQIRSEVSAEMTNVNTNINGLDARITKAESSITQTATEIRSEVKAEFDSVDGQLTGISSDIDGLTGRITKAESSITQTATEIRSEVRASFDTVNGEIDEFSVFQQTVEGFSFMNKGGTVKISGGDINLTGAIKFSDLTDSATVQSQINNANNNASDALDAAANAEDMASDAQDTADGVLTTVNGITIKEGSKTYLDGEMLYTNSVYADAIHLGGSLSVYKTLYGNTVGGYLGYDSGFNSDSGIGIRDSTEVNQVVCTNKAARLSSGDPDNDTSYSQFIANGSYAYMEGSTAIVFEIDNVPFAVFTNHGNYGSFRPTIGSPTMHLGNTSYRWSGVYCETCNASTSDRNLKNNIEDLPDKYITMFDMITPKRYKLNSGSSDRYHVGYIAQEVEEAMNAAGIDSQEFGGFIKDVDEDGNDIYMLRYGEFDAIRDAKIKQLEARNAELEARIEKLEKLLTQNI